MRFQWRRMSLIKTHKYIRKGHIGLFHFRQDTILNRIKLTTAVERQRIILPEFNVTLIFLFDVGKTLKT